MPLTLLAYFAVSKGLKNYVLLLASVVFYFFGESAYTLLLLFSSVSSFVHALIIEKRRGKKGSKAALVSSIAISVLLLGFFKYADFVIGTVNAVFSSAIPAVGIALPIGISFYTFQTMSYTIDVYRGDVRAEKSLAFLATYVCLFPQLIAGPIVRYSEVALALHERRVTPAGAAAGIRRFVLGLAKKVIIANTMGELCAVFRDSGDKSVLFYWLYALAFVIQMYFDFSGYSDMAIGLGRIFGFDFPENFDYPYISRSVTEFWRRWHMTLGGWFRDYVYIPLGGNRVSMARWMRNIIVVWLLTGLWHGAEWNFVLWGLIYGLLIMLEKLFLGAALERSGRAVQHLYVIFVTVITFTIFNADGLSGAVSDVAGLFGAGGLPLVSGEALYNLKSYAVVIVLGAAGSLPVPRQLMRSVYGSKNGARVMTVAEPLVLGALLVAVTACLIDGSFNPFLYFKF